MFKVIAVCTSEKKGTAKQMVEEANLIEEFGIEGDAHAGKWHRQVSLLGLEKIDELAKKYELLLVPSDSFGYKGYLRISYCVDKNMILRSLKSFEKLIKEVI